MTEKIITHQFKNREFKFISTPTAPALIGEIFGDNYHVLKSIDRGKFSFRPADVVLDVGACEGMFSIMLGVLFPYVRVISLEPVPETYYHLVKNIELNGCKNIEAYNLGLGNPSQKKMEMVVSKDFSGGSSAYCTFDPQSHKKVEVGLITLDAAFDLYGINNCRLLKMDTEGAEYDVLYPSHVLSKVDYFVGEFHINRKLEFESRRMDGLVNWVANQTRMLFFEGVRMAE